jgi:methanogenic corrinoid protein MtbC1
VIEGALASGVEPSEIYLDLLVPALAAIGDQWESGEVSVADEHQASVVALRLVGRLGPRFARRGRPRGTIVVGAPSGEEHLLPSVILSDLLRAQGFEVVNLGANAPGASFAEAALKADRLVAVLIGATSTDGAAHLRESIAALRAAGVTVPLLVGGRAVTDDRAARAFGADGWSGLDASHALATVETLLH